MPRQPFLPAHRHKSSSIGLSTLEQNPRLAALVGRSANAWTWVDLHLALTMGTLLGVENKASVAVFASIRNSKLQRDALRAAAKVVLEGEEAEVFEAIMNVHAMLDSERNDIVHGLWGETNAVPDAAVWTSLQSEASRWIDEYGPDIATWDNEKITQNILKGWFVYKLSDIEEVVLKIEALAGVIWDFHAYLREARREAGPSAAALLRQLCDGPLLRQELEKMRS